MNNNEFIREIVRKSKYTDVRLTIKEVKMCILLMREITEEIFINDDTLVIENYLRFDNKELVSKKIRNIKTGEIDLTRDLKVPRVSLSRKFREDIKEKINL